MRGHPRDASACSAPTNQCRTGKIVYSRCSRRRNHSAQEHRQFYVPWSLTSSQLRHELMIEAIPFIATSVEELNRTPNQGRKLRDSAGINQKS